MRNTLEDLYYGNITPNTQDMAPNSELKRATDRLTHFENQLTEQLDEARQAVLAKLIESQQEIDSITALENFVLVFRLGVRIMAECMDDNDGDIRTGGGINHIQRATTPTVASASLKMFWDTLRPRPRKSPRQRWSRPNRWTSPAPTEYTVASWLRAWYDLYAQAQHQDSHSRPLQADD